jgi:hypothetical protein
LQSIQLLVAMLGTVIIFTVWGARIRMVQPAALLLGGCLVGLNPTIAAFELPPRVGPRPVPSCDLVLGGSDDLYANGESRCPLCGSAGGRARGCHEPRFMTLLRAESLINDGTALALLATAVPVAIGAPSRSAAHQLGLRRKLSWRGGVRCRGRRDRTGRSPVSPRLDAIECAQRLDAVCGVPACRADTYLGCHSCRNGEFPACPAWNSVSHSNANSAFLVTDYVCPQFGTVRLGGYSNPLRCR